MEKYVLKLTLEHEKTPLLSEFNAFMYDIELLHDLLLIVSTQRGAPLLPPFTHHFWRRDRRLVKDEYKIRIVSIRSESPIRMQLLVSVGILLVATISTLDNMKTNRLIREKIKMEIKRMEEERERLEKYLSEYKDAKKYLDKLISQLNKNSIKIKDMEISQIEEDESMDENLNME